MVKKKFGSMLASSVLALGVSACSLPPQPEGPIDSIYCDPGERYLVIQIAVERYVGLAPDDPAHAMIHVPINLYVQAVSPVTDITHVRYEGLVSVGLGTGATGPIAVETPYDAVACWPEGDAISLMVKAEHHALQAQDLLECTMENGWSPAQDEDDFIAFDHIAARATDLMPNSKPIAVQCVDSYAPPGYTGPPLHVFPPLVR